MKFLNLISFLFLTLVFSSCHKDDTEKEAFERELPGDYEWIESQSIETNGASGEPLYSYTSSLLEKNVGLRIKKNKKCFLFENGKQIDSGEILKIGHLEKWVYSSYGGYDVSYQEITIDWNKHGNMVFTSGLNDRYLVNSTLPLDGFTNCFRIKEKKHSK